MRSFNITKKLSFGNPQLCTKVNCAARAQFMRVATTSDAAASDTPTSDAEQPIKKRFSAAINFKVPAEKVDSDNCPSAAEIKEILPTADELYQQLPSPSEIRQMYGLDRPGAGRAPPTPEMYASAGVMASLKRSVLGGLSKESDLNADAPGDAATTASNPKAQPTGVRKFFDRFALNPSATADGPHAMSRVPEKAVAGHDEALWPDCDTPEDIMNDEKYGAEGEEAPAPRGEHLILAWKALMYGTVGAVIMTIAVACGMSWYMGFSSLAQIKEHLQTRKARDVERLRQEARERRSKGLTDPDDDDDEDTVHVYELDLTQPTTLMSQLDGLVKLVEDLAAQEDEKKEQARLNAIEGKMIDTEVAYAAPKAPKRTYSL